MQDVSVCLVYLTKGALSRIGRELIAPTSRDGEPGWYVRSYKNEAYDTIVPYTRIASTDAELVARAVDDALGGAVSRVECAVATQSQRHKRERYQRRQEALRAIDAAQRTITALDAEETAEKEGTNG